MRGTNHSHNLVLPGAVAKTTTFLSQHSEKFMVSGNEGGPNRPDVISLLMSVRGRGYYCSTCTIFLVLLAMGGGRSSNKIYCRD